MDDLTDSYCKALRDVEGCAALLMCLGALLEGGDVPTQLPQAVGMMRDTLFDAAETFAHAQGGSAESA